MSGVRVATFSHVHKAYGAIAVLEDFSAAFELGAAHVVMGPSGVGKTTLIRLILGLEKPDAGQIVGLENLRKGAVFQEDRLCENLSVAANLCLAWGKESREARFRRREQARLMLDAVGLAGTLERPVRALSGGMKRRVAILRAVLAPNELLIFDEPLKGLDEQTKHRLMEVIGPLLEGKTLFWVTHDEGDRAFFDHSDLLRMQGCRPEANGTLPWE